MPGSGKLPVKGLKRGGHSSLIVSGDWGRITAAHSVKFYSTYLDVSEKKSTKKSRREISQTIGNMATMESVKPVF